MKFILLILLLLTGCNSDSTPSQNEKLAKAMADAYFKGWNIPLVSETKPDLGLNDAYSVQRHFVEAILSENKIAGYKTGLASEKSQRFYRVESPIFGVLFQSGGMNSINAEVNISEYVSMLVETELGYRVNKEITKPIANTNELDDVISSILPVIELPDVRFAEFNKSKLTDVVAANICSSKFITGKEYDLKQLGSENIVINLQLDDKTINMVNISDSMDYQKELLVRLINNRLKNGWEIKPGQLLITGAIGKINNGREGDYEADYGPLGKIRFKVR